MAINAGLNRLLEHFSIFFFFLAEIFTCSWGRIKYQSNLIYPIYSCVQKASGELLRSVTLTHGKEAGRAAGSMEKKQLC